VAAPAKKSDETPQPDICVLAAQWRAEVTIHIIRAKVSMSQAADNLSPTAVMLLAENHRRRCENTNASFVKLASSSWIEQGRAAHR
jgi:hypothetical protein